MSLNYTCSPATHTSLLHVSSHGSLSCTCLFPCLPISYTLFSHNSLGSTLYTFLITTPVWSQTASSQDCLSEVHNTHVMKIHLIICDKYSQKRTPPPSIQYIYFFKSTPCKCTVLHEDRLASGLKGRIQLRTLSTSPFQAPLDPPEHLFG